MSILIFGHKSPDTDTTCSAIAYAELKKVMGIPDVEAVILGKVNKETKYALEYFKIPEPRMITDVQEGQDVILVDHNEKSQTVANIDKANILEVIDHHRISFATANPVYYRAEPVGCTNTIIAKMYKEKGVAIKKEIAGIMLSAILSDTLIFKSPTCTDEDINVAKELATIAEVDINTYGKDMIIAGASIEGENLKDVINTDIKLFEFGNKKVLVSQVTSAGIESILNNKKEILDVMETIKSEGNADSMVLMLTDIILEGSEILFVGKYTDIIGKTFGAETGKDSVFVAGALSRKKQVIPKLTESLN